nr:hypothetical protein [Dyadobacter sp. SG02]
MLNAQVFLNGAGAAELAEVVGDRQNLLDVSKSLRNWEIADINNNGSILINEPFSFSCSSKPPAKSALTALDGRQIAFLAAMPTSNTSPAAVQWLKIRFLKALCDVVKTEIAG